MEDALHEIAERNHSSLERLRAIGSALSDADLTIVSELVVEGRERLVDRSLHRGDHLRTFGEAFPSA